MRLNTTRKGGTGSVIRIKGVTQVFTNMNREIEAIEGRSLAGLIKGAALIRNETEHGDIKTPVDTGNLRASYFTVTSTGKSRVGRSNIRKDGTVAPKFKGDKADEMMVHHTATISEMQGKAGALASAANGPFLILGYSANYAMWVHEMIGPNIVFKRAGSGPKWFEYAVKKQKDNIIKVIQENARIKR